MKTLQFNDHRIRVLDWPDDPKFVLIDLCKVLGYSNPSKVSSKLGNSQKVLTKIYSLAGGPQKTTVVTRQGFFEILKKSSKKNAPRLLEWLLDKVFRLSDKHEDRRKKMQSLSKTLGFRLSKEKGRWTYRSEGRRRKATDSEIKLWLALKSQSEELALAESHALDRDFAFEWINTYRELRQHATEVVSRSAELSRIVEKCAKKFEEHGGFFRLLGDKNTASKCKINARDIRNAIKPHKEAVKIAKKKLGIGPRKDKAAKPGAAILPVLEIPKS